MQYNLITDWQIKVIVIYIEGQLFQKGYSYFWGSQRILKQRSLKCTQYIDTCLTYVNMFFVNVDITSMNTFQICFQTTKKTTCWELCLQRYVCRRYVLPWFLTFMNEGQEYKRIKANFNSKLHSTLLYDVYTFFNIKHILLEKQMDR